MARVLNLANYNRTTVIDLINGTFKIDKYSWVTSTTDARIRYDYTPFGAQPTFEYYQPVAEVFTLTSCIGGAAALKALHQIQDVMEGVRRYHDGVPTVESWWLEWNTEDEEPKRALIYTMTLDFPVTREVTSNFMECYGTDVRVALTRHPLWENKVEVGIDKDTSVSADGGIMAVTPVYGTAPGRIHDFRLYVTASEPTTALVEHWIGIRPTHNGTAAFTPVWECELGTNGTDAADAGDVTASAANKVTITPGTTTLVKRLGILLSQIEATSTERPDYEGRYLILLRCKVSAGTWGIQMRSGYTDNIVHEEIYVDNTSWYLHELGEVSIPPWASHLLKKADFFASYQISIFGERVSGAGTLDIDCLILIPTEHFTYLYGTSMTHNHNILYAHTLENDTNVAYVLSNATTVDDSVAQIPKLWYIPQEGGILIYAGQGLAAHVLGNIVTIEMYNYPRWLAHRYD